MKGHLTDKELIEYKFKLTSDTQRKGIAEHLEGCAKCRERLEQLKRKFSALDLLRGDVKASEDLISQVIEQTQGGVSNSTLQKRLLRFALRQAQDFARNDTWRRIGAIAAVLLVGLMLLFAHLTEEGKMYEPVKELDKAIVKKPLDPFDRAQDRLARDRPAERMLVARAKEEKAEIGDEFEQPSGHGVRRGATASQRVPAEPGPPFAPASAIELVTLPRRDKVQLTIYNSADLTLVRERRNLTLKKGWNWLQFMWANTLIDPTSLSLEPLKKADKIDIQQLVFPARLRELGRWLIRSEVSGQVPFEITYFTSGLSWRAFYMGTLSQDEKTMYMQGYVRVGNNSGEDYENAQTRLIVGKVHLLDEIAELAKRQYPYGCPLPIVHDKKYDYSASIVADELSLKGRLGVNGFFEDKELRRKEIKKEGLSEYFLYTIEGTETIADKWGKRLLSFKAEDINVTSLYKYDEERWGNQTIRFVSFANDEEHNLGETPIPNGTVKIYSQADEQGYLSYVGGTGIKYIPVNEEVELNLGPARLVKAEPTMMDFKTDNYVFDSNSEICGWDEIRSWQIEITNTRTLPIEIEITRGFDTAYWTLQADIPFEKHDATHARFKLNLHAPAPALASQEAAGASLGSGEPRSKQAFGYTVTTYRGVREEALMKSKEQEKK